MPLDDEERAIYEWQMWVAGFGEEGQAKLKRSSVMVSRCGGVGGAAALYLAAAGVGRLVLAHGGNLKLSDLHRQTLMSYSAVGQPRADCAAQRLRELNPHVAIEPVNENISEANAARLVGSVDLVVDAAPLFTERFLMNRECVRQGKPMVECAMYELEGQVTTIIPGRTPCLSCLYPAEPPAWKRQFPVLGAVAGMIGCIGAMEAIKVLSGLGEPLLGRMLLCNLREMSFRSVRVERNQHCTVCGGRAEGPGSGAPGLTGPERGGRTEPDSPSESSPPFASDLLSD